MDLRNQNRIVNAINALNSVTTRDPDTARWIIDVIDQLEEITVTDNDTRIDGWRKRLGAHDGR